MTRKDDAPTYHAVIRHKNGPVHLSDNGSYTLCHWRISDKWQRHDERIALFVVWLSGVDICHQCNRIAMADREIAMGAA